MFGFIDHAYVFPYKGSGPDAPCYNSNDVLISMGFGFRFQLPGSVSCRICWGFPLMRNHYETNPKCGRFHIELSVTPDFDALVTMRKPKGVEQVKQDDNTKVANRKTKKVEQQKPKIIKSTNYLEVDAKRAPQRVKIFKNTTVFPELWDGVNGNSLDEIKPLAYTKKLCQNKKSKKSLQKISYKY